MDSDRPWFVLAGGGTGGHLYPGLAVIEVIRSLYPRAEVTVFGTSRVIDRKLVAARGYELVPQDVKVLTLKPWRWPGFLGAWRRSRRVARDRFQSRRPAVILGLGGYAAGPPVVAAAKLRIPSAIFNPDAIPGRANRWLGSRVDRVFVQWQATGDRFPRARDVRCTGCPVRSDFTRVDRAKACAALRLDADKPVLLITGASQGAHSLNATVSDLCEHRCRDADMELLKRWQVVHLTGRADLELCRKTYKACGITARTYTFIEEMHLCMAAADLIISRAGASTLAEITVMRRPAILMPYPYDRKRHQLANARVLVDENAAELVEDSTNPVDNAVRLREVLLPLLRSEQHRHRLARAAASMGRLNAAENVAHNLLEMAGLPT
ncbi:MAG: glycosyltransferase [Phycisphaerae bacterium]